MNGNGYSAAFNRAIGFILPHEEDFLRGHWGDENYVVAENVAGDSGGVTKYGIDQASHPGVDIRNLDRPGAIGIYWQEWLKYGINLLPDKIAVAQFDVLVNGGYAILWLQKALNECGASLNQDGKLGPATMAAIAECDQDKVVDYFLKERDSRFESLAEKYPNDRQFLGGWEQRDKDLRAYLLS